MPLGINGYNDAFKAFTDFATQAKSGSTIAQIGGEKNTVAGTGPLAGPARGQDDRREDRIRLHRQRRPPPGVARREQRRARPLQAGYRGYVRRG